MSTHLRPKRIFGDEKACIPRELLGIRRRFPNAALAAELWTFLDDFCNRQRPGAWHTAATLGQELGVAKRTVEFGLAALEQLGYIEREWLRHHGRQVRVIWCLWLVPDRLDGCNLDFGWGIKPRVEDVATRTPRPARYGGEGAPIFAPGGARNAPRGAGRAAQEVAQDVDPRIKSTITLTETSTIVDLIGEGSPEGMDTAVPLPVERVAEVVAPEPLPAPPQPTLAVDDAAQLLAGPFRKSASLMAAAVWCLVDAGREAEIPAWFAGDRRPARPEPEGWPVTPPPAAPQSNPPAPARVALPPLSAPIEAMETQTLLNRLPAESPEVQEAIVLVVADRQAAEWDDGGSLGCFRLKLRLLARGHIQLELFWRAFVAGQRSARGFKGKAFNKRLAKRMAELRQAGIVG